MTSMHQAAENHAPATRPVPDFMTLRLLRICAALVFGTALLVAGSLARGQANEPESPYGGTTVEDIIARVNDQIITKSDYDRALNELDQAGRQHGESMQEMAAARKDLLRNLIDQQLWLSKGKELGITGETELVKRLDEIRKQYNLETIEDLEKAAKEQGVSFEDFKANIRNQIITQEVMRQEVGEHIQMTPGEVERYYEEHKQDYAQPESERLSEILISTGQADEDDPAKVAAAKAKADDIEARLHAGGDFAQLARSFSDGPTAASGGDLGQYKRGQLAKVLEDKTFGLSAGQYTDPILTRQGYIILKVVQHTPGGPRPFKDVEDDVEQAYYMSLMEPAIRDYLSKMRNEAFIQIKPGYVDTGATHAELHPSISFSAYVPPAPKKKAKVERTRFRESTHTFRQKSGAAAPPAGQASATETDAAPTTPAATKKKKSRKKEEAATEKPGKREKIRYGQAPRETLPSATTIRPRRTRARCRRRPRTRSSRPIRWSQPPPRHRRPGSASARERRRSQRRAEVRRRRVRQGPRRRMRPRLPTSRRSRLRWAWRATREQEEEKAANAIAEKTRLANKKKSQEETQPKPAQQPTPIPAVPGAPAPADHPKAPQPQPDSQPTGL